VVGSVVGGITTAAINGASTYALGEVFKTHFATGGTFLDFDTNRLKKLYREKFEKGKTVAKEWKEETEEPEAEAQAPQPAAAAEAAPTPVPKAKKTEKKPTAAIERAPEATPAPMVMDDDVIRKIKELAEMKAQNIITEEEFEAMKKRIIG
jgi:sRNA-binding protein